MRKRGGMFFRQARLNRAGTSHLLSMALTLSHTANSATDRFRDASQMHPWEADADVYGDLTTGISYASVDQP